MSEPLPVEVSALASDQLRAAEEWWRSGPSADPGVLALQPRKSASSLRDAPKPIAMVIFRCTKALVRHLPDPILETAPRSTTALGDWYFKPLFTRPRWLVLAVSEKSRLPIVLPARQFATIHARLLEAVERVFRDLLVSDEATAAELSAMSHAVFAKTIDRSVLGSLNEFAAAVEWSLHDKPGEPLHALNLWLAETPILPLKDFPDRMTRRLLEARIVH